LQIATRAARHAPPMSLPLFRMRHARRSALAPAEIAGSFQMIEYVPVARLSELVCETKVICLEFAEVLLVNVNWQIFALDNHCLCCASSLHGGALRGFDLTCPACGWHYNVATGEVIGLPKLRLDSFLVRVRGSAVEIADVLQ
jgi:nitrite reductase/ring-hydroxylating ferredoxin subunit